MNRSNWRPLPSIRYGVAIANYSPPLDGHKDSGSINHRYSWNGVGNQTITQPNHHAQELLIGDEVYAFEQCQKDDGHLWYRGYVCPPRKVSDKQTEAVVFLGIFPADCIHARTDMPDSQNMLSEAYQASLRVGEQTPRRMDALPEEEEEENGEGTVKPNGGHMAASPDVQENRHSGSRGPKQPPPLPILGMKDLTSVASKDPILDEIASVVSGWYGRLPKYLESCRYKLFETVVGHIQSLLTARIQLMTQILTQAEEHALRREIILVMTRGDIAQELDVMVRDATGRPITTRMEDRTKATWMSGISLFAAQVDNWYSEENSMLRGPAPLINRPASILSTERSVPGKATSAPVGQSLLIEIKTLVARIPVGETVELLLSIWQASSRSYITEECRFEIDRGVSVDAADQRMRTRFQLDDLDDTCSLVIKSIRKGAMTVRPSAKSDVIARVSQDDYHAAEYPGSPALQDSDWFKVEKVEKSPLRRPVGVSIISFAQLRRSGSQAEFSVPVWAPLEETAWASLPLEVLENRSYGYNQSPLIEAIVFTTRAVDPSSFRGLHGAAETRLLSARPGPRQNDLYLKLWSADFKNLIQKGSLLAKSSIQVEMQTRSTSEGNALEAMQLSPGKRAESCNSMTLLGTSQPVWAELLKVDLGFGLSHILFIISDVKDDPGPEHKRHPVAYAYCPLVTGPHSVIGDGDIKLAVMPYDYAMVTAATYTSRSHLAVEKGDSITIKVQNASQKTSDAVILRLLDRKTTEEKPKELLHLLTFCPPVERTKFRSQLVDIILGYLTKHEVADEEVEDVSLRALMAVLEGPNHRQRTQPLSMGLTGSKSAGAASPLLRSVRRVMGARESSSCRRLIQHLGPIVQLVAASRDHIQRDSSEAVGAHLQSQIDSELLLLLTKDIPALYTGGVLAVKVLMLQHYGSMISTLTNIFPRSTLVDVLVTFIDAVGRDSDAKVRAATLSFLVQDIITETILSDADVRDMLLPSCVRVIKAGLHQTTNDGHTGLKLFKSDRLAVSAAAALVHTLENAAIAVSASSKDLVLRLEDNLEFCCARLLLPLLELYKICVSPSEGLIAISHQQTSPLSVPVVFPKSDAPDLVTLGPLETPMTGEIAATILAITQGCPFDRLTSFLSECREVQGPAEAVSLITMAITFHQNILRGQAFPVNWFSCMQLGVASSLTWLAAFIETYKTLDFWVEDSATPLWVQSFDLLSEVLQLVSKSDNHMDPKFEVDGVRCLNGLIQNVPEELGDQALQVTVASLGFCLMSDPVVSQAVPFVYMMLERYDATAGLHEVEEELLRIIDNTPTPDKLYFLEDLRRLAEADTGKAYSAHLLDVLSHAEDFLDLHLTLRETNLSVSDRAWAQLRQCDYLRDTNHRDLHSAACAKLQSSLRTTYLTGSGLALARLGSLYEWSNDVVYNGKTRAVIMDEATDILIQSKQYPLALELCAFTTTYHQQQTFDYERIAQLLRQQADLYDLLPGKAVTSIYHRIRIFGATPMLSDYVLVTTGEDELRRFCNRLLTTWPGALIVESAPGPDMTSDDTTVILVERLDPEPEIERDCIRNARYHEYYLTNDLGQFSITRKSEVGEGVERETIYTANSFPSILPFSPIIRTTVSTLSALEYANIVVKKEVTKVLQINLKPEASRKAARIQLDNAIDLPQDLGLLRFRKTFLDPATSTQSPETLALSAQLMSYAKAAHSCLQIHTTLCPAELTGYHKNLVKLFKRNFAPEIQVDPSLAEGIEILPAIPTQANGIKEKHSNSPAASPPSIKVIATAPSSHTTPVKQRAPSNAKSLAPSSDRPDSRLSVSSNTSSRGPGRLASLLRRNK